MTRITDPDTGSALDVQPSAVRRHVDGVDPRVAELEAENARLREAVTTARNEFRRQFNYWLGAQYSQSVTEKWRELRDACDAALKETSHDG